MLYTHAENTGKTSNTACNPAKTGVYADWCAPPSKYAMPNHLTGRPSGLVVTSKTSFSSSKVVSSNPDVDENLQFAVDHENIIATRLVSTQAATSLLKKERDGFTLLDKK